jgi:acetyl esterase/lipase
MSLISTMQTKRTSVASLLFSAVFAAALPTTVSAAGPSSAERCDGEKAARIVNRQLAVQEDGKTSYQELVMREPHEEPADARIYYGSDLQQFGDLRLPKGRGPFPVAVIVHGGGWGSSVSLHYMQSMAASLACAGVATWNIEFRRLGSGGQWPNMFQDMGAATDFLRQVAQKYPLDLSRGVVAIGHSSGGSLAGFIAMRHRLRPDSELYTPDPLLVVGGISLDGALDMIKRLQDGPKVASDFAQLFGTGSPETTTQRLKDASPRHYLPLRIPMAIVHGNPGGFPSWGCCGTPEFIAEARASGDSVELVEIPGAGHFESADPTNPIAGPTIRRVVRSMLGLRNR